MTTDKMRGSNATTKPIKARIDVRNVQEYSKDVCKIVYLPRKAKMKKTKMAELIAWKNAVSRKPLIIRGARQVGKTWLMKEFGNAQYDQTIYINFEKNKRLKDLFADDFDIKRVIIALQAESGLTIHAENTT
jgi:predicted AAA+ superfamily ATPase